MSTPHLAHAHSLCRFIEGSPSPYHVAANAAEMLADSGFTVLGEADPDPSGPGRFARASDGRLVSWIVGEGATPTTPFRIVGAHTDSPNLRIKPRPEARRDGYRRIGVEIYGGVLLNSWLDRDLGISGRISVRGGSDVPEVRLVHVDEPLLRIPQLAIHLDRDVNEKGLILDRQQHLAPIFGLDDGRSLLSIVAESVDTSLDDIVGFDLMLHDLSPSRLVGDAEAFISSARLDNQLSCHAAITAITGASAASAIPIVVLFDHEEVGNTSATGAGASMLPRLLRRISTGLGAGDADADSALRSSLFISADNAHATHPNYPERHDPAHRVAMNAGPVLKFNAGQRYTTDSVSAGVFRLAAERAGVSTQSFVSRSDMPCGSTIGPTVAAGLGVRSLDVGCAQLAMHSARELAGSHDPWDMTLVLAELLS